MVPVLPLIAIVAIGAYLAVSGSKKDAAAAPPGIPLPNLPFPGGNAASGGANVAPVSGDQRPQTDDQLEGVAVRTALALETSPDALDEFAESLLPDYPSDAQALHNRAAQLRGSSPPQVIVPTPQGPAPVAPTPDPFNPPAAPPVAPSPPPDEPPVPPFVPPPDMPVDPGPGAQFPAAGSTGYVDTPSGLHLRDQPNTSGAVIETMVDGAPVSVLADGGGGWLLVQAVSGNQGYADAEYLAAAPAAAAGGGNLSEVEPGDGGGSNTQESFV